MSYSTGSIRSIFAALMLVLPISTVAAAENSWWNIPEPRPAAEYGNLLMNRSSEKNGMKPVVFSHWVHRRKHTCRVCHFELEFNMKENTTEISEEENRAGRYCGACHDGKRLFGHADKADCAKCHNGDRAYGSEKFRETVAGLPKARSGNGVNWVKALDKMVIMPVSGMSIPEADMNFDRKIKLEAEWWNIPPAVFPHGAHVRWLDCNNCHPDIFNIKKKTTKHFLMTRILAGEFCGVCHGKVAFPLDECGKCHPGLKGHEH